MELVENPTTLQDKVNNMLFDLKPEVYKSLSEVSTYLAIVNTPPKKDWLKQHPTAKGVMYLPIDKVEYLMTAIHQEWKLEIISVTQIMNSIVTHVRLHYKTPYNSEWKYQDGVGAVGVQTDKDARASDMSAIKSDAVMKAAPASESYAMKDAAEKIGKIFGSDVNRKDTLSFYDMFSDVDEISKKKQELKEKLDEDN